MAGDWIKFEVATPDKPEICEIANALSIDPDAVVGKLLRVWCWFDQQTEDGNAPSVSKMLLDRLVGVNGFCKTIIDAGWMLDDGKLLTLPHFDRHNGKTAKNRALTAKRVASHKVKNNAKGNDCSVSSALPREEKRREDISNTGVLDKADSKKRFDPLSLAEQMPPELGRWWSKWVAYRRERKLTTKEPTWKLQAEKLMAWGKDGHDPCDSISDSISNGWQGLFEPKPKFNGGHYAANQQPNGSGNSKPKVGPAEQVRAQARIAIERIDAEDGSPNLYADDGFIQPQGD